MKVAKVVVVGAGWGTRFLPVTRSQPKEMLPLVDKPLIHYAVDEAIESGIEQVIVITAQGKGAIEDYFDRAFGLEHFLEQKGKTELLQEMRDISDMVDVSYVRQKEQLGLGHAILTASNLVGRESFAVILPDDIIDGPLPGLKQLLQVSGKYGAGVVAVKKVSGDDVKKYGIIDSEQVTEKVYKVRDLVEKPEPSGATSRLGIVGRYILPPEIFDVLRETPPGAGGEIQLTDALRLLLKKQSLYARELDGVRYDTGTPQGWLEANVSMALKRDDIGPGLRKYLKNLL